MKKIALLAAMVLAGSTLLFAGGRQAAPASSSDGLTVIKAWGLDKQYPLADRSISLSEWVNGSVPSRIFDKFTEEMAKIGIKIDYTLVMSDQIGTAFQTMLASGQINDYDWIAPVNVDTRTRFNLIDQKQLQPLNQAIQQYSKGPARDFFFNDAAGKQLAGLNTVEDGNFYWLSQSDVNYYKTPENGIGYGRAYVIRKDWLDKAGLPMPRTLDEFYNTLVAFRQKDVNGNGIKDEVVDVSTKGFGIGIPQWFGLGNELVSVIDGKAVSPWYQTHIKDYLAFVAKLYKDGLVSVTGDGNEKAANKIGGYGAYMQDTFTEPTVIVPAGAPRAYYAPLVIQAVPDTKPRVVNSGGVGQYLGSGMYSVPARSKKIEAVVKMIDFFESPEYPILNEFGIEGYTFKTNADGTRSMLSPDSNNVGIDMNLYMLQLPALWSGWQGIFPRYLKGDRSQDLVMVTVAGQELGYPEGFTLKRDALTAFFSRTWPTVMETPDGTMGFPTPREVNRISEINPDLKTYSSELITALIMGEKSLDNWDSYIADLKRLGLDELIAIYQARLDRTK